MPYAELCSYLERFGQRTVDGEEYSEQMTNVFILSADRA